MSANDAYSTINGLTQAEKDYLREHPEDTFALRRSRHAAYEETSRLFGRNGHNDESDAFRHCYWSALLASEIGFVRAVRFTTAHESAPNNILRERDMDLHNNRIGLRIGRDAQKNSKLSERCLAALKNGELKFLRNRKKWP